MLDELRDAKKVLCNTMDTCQFGLIPRVPSHMLEENSDLPNLDPEDRFRKIAEMRHKCRMAAIETESFVHYWRAVKHKVIGWGQLGSLELKEEMSVYLIVRQLSMCKKTAAYGIARRARNARDADENWRRRSLGTLQT